MCGIAGIFADGGAGSEALAAMAAEMRHRGPDGQGFWHGGDMAFAFRRLAIIDLDERSNQPQQLGPLHIVFNGEIYNYRELREELRREGHTFRTEGDCEVLLHAWQQWQEGALERVNGMFAFAIWDEQQRALTLACDAFGEKPLFWAYHRGRLLFASDIRAILAVDPDLARPREAAIGPYLARGLMPPVDESFFAGVNRLAGSHLLRFQDGRVEVKRWWKPERVQPPPSYEESVALLRELLADSIRLRLRSDVPVGTSLSGGVDSSAVVSLAAQIAGEHRRHAFTARFPGFARDEWKYASAVASSAGVVEHHAVEPTGEELLEDLQELVASHEEPVGSSSIYAQYRVMRAALDAGVTVLLDGQGADELFGGYRGTPGWATRAEGPVAELRALAGGGTLARETLLAIGAERLPTAVAARHRLRASSPYVARDVAHAAAALSPPRVDWAAARGPLVRELARQAFHTSMPALLRYADRNSMAYSREVRLPFLDRRVAELALSVPPDYLYAGGVTKRLLRDAVADVVPAEVLARRDKVGFETPEASWLSSPAAIAQISEVLLDDGAHVAGRLDLDTVRREAAAGRWSDPNGVWRALNLELWLRFASAPRRAVAPVLGDA